MKKSSLTCVLMLFMIGIIHAQLPNPDFENWITDSLGFTDPVGYDCSNLQLGVMNVIQDIGYDGTGYSVKFTSVYDSISGLIMGGSLEKDHVPFTGSTNPTVLSGYWSCINPHNTDAIYAEVDIYDALNNMIGYASNNTPYTGSTANWTAFNIPFNYSMSGTADNYTIYLFLGNLSHDSTVYAHVDHVGLDVTSSVPSISSQGMNWQMAAVGSHSYHFTCDKVQVARILLFDVSGKLIRKEMNINSSFDLDLSNCSTGNYFCVIQSEESSRTFRLIR